MRTLLVLVVVLAIPLGWVAKERRQSQSEQKVAVLLESLGVKQIDLRPIYADDEYDWDEQSQSWWQDIVEHVLGRRIVRIGKVPDDFKDVTLLASLSSLQILNLDHTAISDLSPLSGLHNLQVLGVHYTAVNNLEPLAGLKNLQELGLNHTEIHDLSPLAKLTNLRAIVLDDTAVSDLTPLLKLPKLEILYLRRTDASDQHVQQLQNALPECAINR